jgi:hypothetical protein
MELFRGGLANLYRGDHTIVNTVIEIFAETFPRAIGRLTERERIV